jgi:glycogen debranching enzyme
MNKSFTTKRIKAMTIVVLTIGMISCESDPYESIPVIKLSENENKEFTYTNKVSGFYMGNSHRENDSDTHGWTVNEFCYLNDYNIYVGSTPVSRDSIPQFNFYPSSFVRNYKYPITETFTLLDSIDAIIWEFESKSDLHDFTFQPQFAKQSPKASNSLSPSSTRVIYTPQELKTDSLVSAIKWMGFVRLPIENRKVVVIGALEISKNRLNRLLDLLSSSYEEKKDEKIKRLSSLLELNNTYTNLPEVTEAIAWSQISIDALVTKQENRGIRTGIPWFKNYKGRESFISFAGAFLVNGNFSEAREVLEYFSRFQLDNEADNWDGRIPNHIDKGEITYNTSDCTWLFVRAAFEYLLYSGDTSLLHLIYPVIKKAIKGAIRHRIDKNFFLIHDDTDTWMDARSPAGAWSPRGNRAIEIQALWYTSLQIGSKFARLKNEVQLAEHWLAISHTLRKNFSKKYWSTVKNEAYDHLNEDGFPDRKMRPNQIFALQIPLLPGIEPLLTQDQSARLTSNVVQNLTYRYGVASLWQEDANFHPKHNQTSGYHKDAACHNGTVWTWLAGPVITSLLTLNQHELAFRLFYDMAFQILQDDAIGTLAQLRDALPGRDSTEPPISGKASYALSLAEFTRVFYQDFVGYRPDALEKKVTISPKIPGDLTYFTTKLPYEKSVINLTFCAEEEGYKFDFFYEDGRNEADIIFRFPGYDPVEFRLDGEKESFELLHKFSSQRSYYLYQELDWYFAQPILQQNE